MIEGLNIELTSAELKEHLLERAKHHKERANWYAKQAEQLQAGHVRSEGLEDRHARSFDPLDGLQAKTREHRDKAAYFQFMADHIVPEEMYRLSEQDLARLEVFSHYF